MQKFIIGRSNYFYQVGKVLDENESESLRKVDQNKINDYDYIPVDQINECYKRLPYELTTMVLTYLNYSYLKDQMFGKAFQIATIGRTSTHKTYESIYRKGLQNTRAEIYRLSRTFSLLASIKGHFLNTRDDTLTHILEIQMLVSMDKRNPWNYSPDQLITEDKNTNNPEFNTTACNTLVQNGSEIKDISILKGRYNTNFPDIFYADERQNPVLILKFMMGEMTLSVGNSLNWKRFFKLVKVVFGKNTGLYESYEGLFWADDTVYLAEL